MTRLVAILALASLVLTASEVGALERTHPSPFQLPVGAKVLSTSADGKGWMANCEIRLSFRQTQAQLASRLDGAGWVHVHTIRLGRDRSLETWSRGPHELTLMVWRIAAGRSGFSYGVSSKAGAGGAGADGRRQSR